MARIRVATVKALWRYPVKSLVGEEMDELAIDRHGAHGDRAFALRDLETRRIASAKKFPQLLTLRAAFDQATVAGSAAQVRITFPNGRTIHTGDPDCSRVISEVLGHGFQLEHTPHPGGEFAGIDPRTVFGEVPFEAIYPGLTADRAPNYFRLPVHTFFDAAVLHLLATGTLRHMRALTGGQSDLDPRRFRPNILVDTGEEGDGFVEDGWLDRMLEIGHGLRISGIHPALRCVMPTHPQQGLPRDPAIMRVAARHHQANVGVFAAVEEKGRVHIGDPVFLLK